MEKEKLTIRDVARMANVSRSTVSLALNDSPRINAQTKARVLRLIEKIGYRPNAMARGLASSRAGVVSVVVPRAGHIFSDSYFSESLSGVLDAAQEAGYRVAIETASEEFRSRAGAERLFLEGRTDGLLAVGALVDDAYLTRLFESGRPVVLVNSELGGVPAVVADNVEGAVAVVHHLASLGCRAIGYIKGLDSVTAGLQRDEGFRKGLRLCGLPLRQELVAFGNFSEESGYRAMDEILVRSAAPDAVFAANDMMAIGAMRRLKEAGMIPGRGIALVGGDDAPLARYIEPPLTTLRQSMYDLGAEAARMLIRWLRTRRAPTERNTLHTELVIRASCGAQQAQKRKLA